MSRLALEMPPSLQRIGDVTLDLPGADGKSRRSVYLHAGQVHAAAEPTSVVTVLGSCVAVCLFDPKAGVGGMNHFLLPYATIRDQSARFGGFAMTQLLQQVLKLGATLGSLQAKVFGGACVIDAFKTRNLGSENVEVAMKSLQDAGVPVVESDVSGQHGRKVVFHSDTGAAWVRAL
jgi:chemotaxis protein CheD